MWTCRALLYVRFECGNGKRLDIYIRRDVNFPRMRLRDASYGVWKSTLFVWKKFLGRSRVFGVRLIWACECCGWCFLGLGLVDAFVVFNGRVMFDLHVEYVISVYNYFFVGKKSSGFSTGCAFWKIVEITRALRVISTNRTWNFDDFRFMESCVITETVYYERYHK